MAHPQHHTIGRAVDLRLLDQDGAVAWAPHGTDQTAHPESKIARDHPEIAGPAPAALARLRLQQLLANSAAHDLFAEGQPRKVAGCAAAAERRAQQHDPARRQPPQCLLVLEGLEDHQSAQAVSDQVQRVGANFTQRLRQAARILRGIGGH